VESMALDALTRLDLTLGDAAAAQVYASELVQKYPANPANRQLLAEALAQQHRLREAEAQVLLAAQLAPNNPVVHLNLAQVYFAEKKWPEAQKEFEQSFVMDSDNATTLGQYADFLTSRGQNARALSLVQDYVSNNPNDANGHEILGAQYFESKNYPAAQSEFERAVQLDPKSLQARLRLGKVLEASGQTQSAVAQYQKALDLQPTHAPLATMVGNFYLKYYTQALSSDPNFPVANADMAWVDAQEGKNLDIALGMAQKAKSLMPESPSITDTLGWVMYKRGSYENALPLLRDCVEKSPDSARYHYHLGMTLIAAGQKSQGRQQLEMAMHMNLDSPDAQQARLAIQTN
jgi:Tfp pilus assembly protein PilF